MVQRNPPIASVRAIPGPIMPVPITAAQEMVFVPIATILSTALRIGRQARWFLF
jgi:hypothetical protein